jgi:4-amino-4-deoxy-L-arabinose transferase-like glycosyltransferase
MLNDKLTYGLLAGIIVVFALIGSLYAIQTPSWQAPDEPAHFNYVEQLVKAQELPVLSAGDWDTLYLEQLKAEQFPDEADLSHIEYEDHQPPLYYLLAATVYRISGGSLLSLRLLSVVLGTGIILAAYFTAARLLPGYRTVALAVAAFVAFVPQHIAMLSSVNNDSLAELMIAVLMVVAITYLGNPVNPSPKTQEREALSLSCRPHSAALGGLVGLAFLTKLTIYGPAVAIAGTAVILRWRIENHPVRWLLKQVAWAAGLALLIGSIWWIRNISIYGWPDIFGQIAHESVVVGQPRTANLIAGTSFPSYLWQLVATTYRSFWGQFGWMSVPMPRRVYLVIGLFIAFDLAGLVILMIKSSIPETNRVVRAGGVALLLGLLTTVFQYLYYNVTFVQFQGRYLFPALIPLGLIVAAGLWGWKTLLEGWLKHERWQKILIWLPLLGVSWLPLLAVYALFSFIVPNL